MNIPGAAVRWNLYLIPATGGRCCHMHRLHPSYNINRETYTNETHIGHISTVHVQHRHTDYYFEISNI